LTNNCYWMIQMKRKMERSMKRKMMKKVDEDEN
jgi:hypothetical protein